MQDAFKVAHSRAVQQLRDVLRFMAEAAGKGPENALIIDGKALTHALAPDVKALLLEVGPVHVLLRCCLACLHADCAASGTLCKS